jgi:hypothetical protein
MLRNAGERGISLDPTALYTGGNSGYQAINLALLTGAATVLLVAYDGSTGHWHPEHPAQTPVDAPANYRRSARSLAEHLGDDGALVFNCSLDSLIDAFPPADLEGMLCLT